MGPLKWSSMPGGCNTQQNPAEGSEISCKYISQTVLGGHPSQNIHYRHILPFYLAGKTLLVLLKTNSNGFKYLSWHITNKKNVPVPSSLWSTSSFYRFLFFYFQRPRFTLQAAQLIWDVWLKGLAEGKVGRSALLLGQNSPDASTALSVFVCCRKPRISIFQPASQRGFHLFRAVNSSDWSASSGGKTDTLTDSET